LEACHIYLSGSIKKGSQDNRDSFWSDSDLSVIRQAMDPIRIEFLNPAVRSDDVTDALSTFGHDLFQVYCSDFVLVDARDRRGLGIGVEMAFANYEGIPVVILARKNSYYFRDSLEYLGQKVEPFVHPFVFGLSSYIGYHLEDVSGFIKKHHQTGTRPGASQRRCTEAMQHYVQTNLVRDKVMWDVVSRSQRLQARVASLSDSTTLNKALVNYDDSNPPGAAL
jgi:hypothetical protein